jgi:DNA-binding HxlR family transcriptional regulator
MNASSTWFEEFFLPYQASSDYNIFMAQRGRLFGCPVEFALDALGGKWKTVILARIKDRPMRYSELRREIPSLSEKMLTQRLADLIEIGFVALATGSDFKERYDLTERGRGLTTTLQALYDWGIVQGREVGVRFGTDFKPDS